jgi:GAF domain-containing protein
VSAGDISKPRDVDHDDVQMLHASLLDAERRAAMMAEVIEALSLSPDATILAQRAVELVSRASRADGAFVYLWDAERSLLVLRAATEGRQQRFVNKLTLRLGEGITGWSALMRRPAVIHDDLLEDPRFVHIPSAMEADFRSALFVPILVPGGEPVGVFSIYSTSPHVFNEQMAETVSEVATLLASGIDRAAQFEVRTRQSKALHSLVGMAESPPRTVTAALAAVAERCLTIIPANLCVVELTEAESHGEDVVGLAVARSDQDRLPERARATGTTDSATVHALLRNWEPRLEVLSQPIRVSGRLVGTVTCHRHSRFASDDRLLLEAVTNYAALVITGTTTSGPSPLDELMRGRDASRAEQLLAELGWAPKSLATPFIVRVDPDRRLTRQQALVNATRVVENAINTRSRRLVPDRPGTVAGLALGAVVDEDTQATVVRDLEEVLTASGHRARIVVGWGGPSAAATGLVEGLRSAADAATWATLVQPAERMISYKENAILRNLAAATHDVRHDLTRTRNEIAQIGKLDEETGSTLVETLRAYVAHHGSAADAAKQLFIHRNTMRQRLDKLERTLSLPLDSPEGWLITRLALLIHDRECGSHHAEPYPLGSVQQAHG